MEKIQIFHNPSCSTSNKAMLLLKDFDVEIDTILYLKKTPTASKIKALLKKLNLPAEGIVRKKEPIFIENFAGKTYTEDEWIEILVKNPKLIERPIVIKGRKAIIARPVENINELMKKK
ncbi:MAG: arsenate reductase (glutaredoxin) [Bacteroidota bacterium]